MGLIAVLLVALRYPLWVFLLVDTSLGYEKKNAGLKSIPSGIKSSETLIELSGNALTSIGSGAFSAFGSLMTVTVNDNKITGIHAKAFCGTPLRRLEAKFNQLSQMPELSCVGSSLRDIYVSGNNIKSLSHCKWELLVDLRNLYVDENPELSSILPLKDNCPMMTSMSIGYTNIHSLEGVIQTCPRMNYFMFKHIPTVGNFNEENAFANTKLSNLDLQYLGMSEFPDLVHMGAAGVGVLSVAGNEGITTVPVSKLTALGNLHTLRMERTGLTSLPDLSPLRLTLQEISITHTYITSISHDAFQGFKCLERMRYAEVNLDGIPHFSDAALTMKYLDMARAGLTAITHEELSQFEAIEELNLGFNEISHDWSSLIQIAPTIKILKIPGGKMKCFDFSLIVMMPNLQEIDVSSQWLDCVPDVSSGL